MGYTFTLDDVRALSSPEGAAALAEVDTLELSTRTHLADIGGVRARFGAATAALVETVLLRRKAVAKLRGAGWLLTDDALQQATPTLVAAVRARRLTGRRVHDVTCSIGAELDALVAECPVVIGSDLDPVRLAMAQRNVPAAHLLRADALMPTTRDTVILADPARRAGGRRQHRPEDLMPPLPDLLTAYAGRDIAVKSAPGLDFDALGWAGEVELVSLDGGVREACLWSPGLSGDGVTRRATVLGSGGFAEEYTDAEPDELPEKPVGQWIIDPDGAIVRAGLVRHYAARHGLWQLDPRIAYVTGDQVPAGTRGHRVLEELKYSEKALRQVLSGLDCGALEILVRGVDVDPDMLRRKLKQRGSRSLSVVLTRVGRTPTAFVCEPTLGFSK
ncbi:class I SAM-dependent methyltransferase [Tomitella biformata]|uniref:class I SAM-dependent methyltransferase n=1 Tax=Tomitella biformata TaxID=630403 RepID=UPI000465C2EA|nr:hypothetical protein [Tomitella biformata]